MQTLIYLFATLKVYIQFNELKWPDKEIYKDPWNRIANRLFPEIPDRLWKSKGTFIFTIQADD